MAKRKKAVKEPNGKSVSAPDPKPNVGETGFEENHMSFNMREAEQRITAIRAISNAETENLLSRLRLVRSYFNSEQLQTPVLRFFEENLPNLSLVKNDKFQLYELEWKHRDTFDFGDTSVLPATTSLEFSTKSAKQSLLRATSLQIPDFVLGESSENQFQGLWNCLQTPGASSSRLSVGMTPKSSRQPKHGEMLMSVYGSPLGPFKEENLEAIHESGDGSHVDTEDD